MNQEVVSPTSIAQVAYLLSPERNSTDVDDFQDADMHVSKNSADTSFVSKNKIKRLRHKKNTAMKKEKHDVEMEYLNQLIDENKKNIHHDILNTKKTTKNHKFFDMYEEADLLVDILQVMIDDIKNQEVSEFWHEDGSPKIYFLIDDYIKKNCMVTPSMLQAVQAYRREVLQAKIKLADDPTSSDYLFSDINDSYACLMHAMLKKKDPSEIQLLLQKCLNLSKLFMKLDDSFFKTDQCYVDNFATLDKREIHLLQHNNFFDQFMMRYSQKYGVHSDAIDIASFRSKAISIVRDLHIENPEPYVQALQKVVQGAVMIKSLSKSKSNKLR